MTKSAALEAGEIEARVREPAPFLAEGAVEVASLPYVDPARFDPASAETGALNALAIAIAPENVSLLAEDRRPRRHRHRGQGAAGRPRAPRSARC